MKKSIILLLFIMMLFTVGFDNVESLGNGEHSKHTVEPIESFDGNIIESIDVTNDFTKQNIIYASMADNELVGGTFTGTGINYWNQFTNHYVYELLSERDKKLWDNLDLYYQPYLLTDADYVDTVLRVEDFDSFTSLFNSTFVYLYCHPQYYFLRPNLKGFYGDGYYSIQIVWYDDFKSGAKRKESTKKVNEYLNTKIKILDNYFDEMSKIKKIHDLICNEVSYDYDAVQENYDWNKDPFYTQSIYDAVCSDKIICAGYARIYNCIASGAGLTTISITGSGHAWNAVQISGIWYYLDATWDDCINNYRYFLVAQSEFSDSNHYKDIYWNEYLSNVSTINYRGFKTYDGITSYSYNPIPFGCNFITYILGTGNRNTYDHNQVYHLPQYLNIESTKIQLPNITRTGYKFLRWKYNGEKISKITYGRDYILEAEWQPITYNISFKRVKGKGNMKTIKKILYDESVTLPSCTFKYKGHTFKGWTTDKKGTTVKYKDGDTVKNLTNENETVKLYAVWD